MGRPNPTIQVQSAPEPDGAAEVRWAPHVNPATIRRLYETDALGIVDEALIYAKNYKELLVFLDTLTYGDASTPGLCESKAAWDRKIDSNAWHRAIGFRPPSDPHAAE